jgi:hypothetical protein
VTSDRLEDRQAMTKEARIHFLLFRAGSTTESSCGRMLQAPASLPSDFIKLRVD